MTDLKKWMTTALLWLLLLSATAQERANTTYTFHFVPQNSTHAALTIAGGFAVAAAVISFARISLPLPEGLARKTRKSK